MTTIIIYDDYKKENSFEVQEYEDGKGLPGVEFVIEMQKHWHKK